VVAPVGPRGAEAICLPPSRRFTVPIGATAEFDWTETVKEAAVPY